MSRIIVPIILLLLSLPSFAQKFIYDIELDFFFDNREYHSPYSPPQTITATRLSPLVGVELMDDDSVAHRLWGGIHYIQPIGCDFADVKLLPAIFYHYEGKKYSIKLGSIPFSNLHEPLPDYLMYDSISYFYPNIRGALFQHQSKHAEAAVQLDWRGMQSDVTREAFRIIMNGKYKHKYFYVGGYVMLNHLANNADTTIREGVCDGLLLNPMIGLTLHHNTPFEKLHLQIGYLNNYQRMRITGEASYQQGLRIESEIKWKFLGVKNALYVGDNLYPFYPILGSLFNIGDPHYQSKVYNRTDFYVYILEKDFIKCYFSWNIHYVTGYKIGNQQQLLLAFDLEKIPKRKKEEKNNKL